MTQKSQTQYPAECTSPGKKIQYLSTVLLPQHAFESYLLLLSELLDDGVHYIDPVHELTGKESVLQMLEKVIPRAANSEFRFDLILDSPEALVWRWTIVIRLRILPVRFTIHGLVYAELQEGKIVSQREYYDPMESIGKIPLLGALYKLALKMG